MPSLPQQPPVSFESEASPEALLRSIDKVLRRRESATDQLPATLDLGGHVDGDQVAIHRNPPLFRPRVEFRGVVIGNSGGSRLAGAYRDVRAHIRLVKFAAPVAFFVASAYGLGRGWNPRDFFVIVSASCVAAILAYVSDRFHLANRNAERDLLRTDIESVVKHVKKMS